MDRRQENMGMRSERRTSIHSHSGSAHHIPPPSGHHHHHPATGPARIHPHHHVAAPTAAILQLPTDQSALQQVCTADTADTHAILHQLLHQLLYQAQFTRSLNCKDMSCGFLFVESSHGVSGSILPPEQTRATHRCHHLPRHHDRT